MLSWINLDEIAKVAKANFKGIIDVKKNLAKKNFLGAFIKKDNTEEETPKPEGTNLKPQNNDSLKD